MKPSAFFGLVRRAIKLFGEVGGTTHGAALAYYGVFSLAPLLLIALGMASLLLGEADARRGLRDEIRQRLGDVPADALFDILDTTRASGGEVVTLVGLGALLFGASGAFVQLQDSLRAIWKSHAPAPEGNAVIHFLRHRLLAFLAVLGTGLVLLAALGLSTAIASISDWLPGSDILANLGVWRIVSLAASFALLTLQFGALFKWLPDVPNSWRDVWLGAAVAALLFTVGQFGLGLYLGQSATRSAFGAAGSVVIVLVWVYYSSQILLFGAAFACVHARWRNE